MTNNSTSSQDEQARVKEGGAYDEENATLENFLAHVSLKIIRCLSEFHSVPGLMHL